MTNKPDLTNTLRWLQNFRPSPSIEADNFVTQNAICCPDGKYLVSSYGWDYQAHMVDGVLYSVDGGCNEFTTRNGDGKEENLVILSDDPFEEVRNKLLWGSYGKTGKEPLHWIRLKDMEENHIDNVLKMIENDSSRTAKWRRDMMMKELKYRKLSLIGREDAT